MKRSSLRTSGLVTIGAGLMLSTMGLWDMAFDKDTKKLRTQNQPAAVTVKADRYQCDDYGNITEIVKKPEENNNSCVASILSDVNKYRFFTGLSMVLAGSAMTGAGWLSEEWANRNYVCITAQPVKAN